MGRPPGPHISEDWVDALDLGALGFAQTPDPERLDDHHPVWMRALPGGACLFFRPDDEAENPALHVYIANPRFARVMTLWQKDDSGPLRAMPRRKLRNDGTIGCLAMAHLDFGDRAAAPDTPLSNGGVSLSLADLSRHLDRIEGPADLNDALIRGRLGHWMAVIEESWVFLFLAAEAGLDASRIAAQGEDWRHAVTSLARWPKTPPITIALARAYLDRHAAALAA